MRIYLAAPYAMRNALGFFAEDLTAAGHEITSTWLTAEHEISSGTLGTAPEATDDYCREHVAQDLEDILRSDLLIVFSWKYCTALIDDYKMGPNSGGRHVETGAALVSDIPVIVVGEAENIFHRGACAVAASWAEVNPLVQEYHNRRFGINTEPTTTD